MRVTLLQTDIVWEDKQENLLLLREKLIKLCGEAEIVVLPETFSTGFSMDSRRLAEPVSGETITLLRQWAAEFQFAITGSYIACDEEADANKNAVPSPDKSYYNRAFFLTPEGVPIVLAETCNKYIAPYFITRNIYTFRNTV